MAIGAAVLSGVAPRGASAEEPALEVEGEILNNHGHEFKMALPELISVLRRLQPENKIEAVSIKGQSHPHSLNLEFEDVLKVLVGESVELESTNDFGHSHLVNLSLDLES